MPLPLTVSCFNKIQIGFTFLVPAHLGSPGKGPLNGCVCLPGALSNSIEVTYSVSVVFIVWAIRHTAEWWCRCRSKQSIKTIHIILSQLLIMLPSQ